MKISKLIAYAAFCVSLAALCYLRPLRDDFDRYVYEALIRSSNQPIGDIYRIVKHESPRAKASSVMDSPEHLAQLEPLYAIRPLYVQVTSLLSRAGMGPQAAINLVSSISLMMCAVIIGVTTRQYLCSALLMASPGIMTIGRMGTPDALSSLAVLAGCLALYREKVSSGILLLMLSVWIRTDNVLFVIAILVWLVWKKRMPLLHSIVLGIMAFSSVLWINHLSGNYGWRVLFHYSFIGGRYPAEITPHINVGQYVRIVLENLVSLGPQLAPWLLLGIAAWMLSRNERGSLIPIGAASLLHYLMFPSGESRYFAWAFLLIGVIFMRAISERLASDRKAVFSPLLSRTAKMAAA